MGSLMAARGESDALTRDFGESMLTRAEAALSMELDRDVAGGLSLAELYPALDRVEPAAPDLGQLERMLDIGEATILNGIQLSSLLDRAGEGPKILKKGLVFLRRGRFGDAVEWFSLNRSELGPNDPKLDLLLLMMEMLARELSGDEKRAQTVRDKVREHPEFKRLTLGPPKGA